MYRGKSAKTQDQQLKVQELAIRTTDNQMYVTDAGDVVVLIGEPVAAVVSVIHQDDSAAPAGVLNLAAAALSIVDSTAPYAAGGDMSAIRVAATVLAAGDVLMVKYITQN